MMGTQPMKDSNTSSWPKITMSIHTTMAMTQTFQVVKNILEHTTNEMTRTFLSSLKQSTIPKLAK